MFANKVERALDKIREIFPPTPLEFSRFLSQKHGAKIFLKREDLTPVRSYKVRGAFFFVASFLQKDESFAGKFVCASAGNHAQGLAFSCAHFGKRCVIFMPTVTPQQKIDRTKKLGGKWVKIHLVGDTVDESLAAAEKFCKKEQGVFVPPFDHEQIITGQATLAAEILESESDVDLLLTPVGGGGLAAGIISFFKERRPQTKIFCVEPEGKQTLQMSLAQGRNICNEQVDVFCDGVAVKKLGEKPWKILRKNLHTKVLNCPENRVAKTILQFLLRDGIILEPAGALAVDAVKNFSKSEIAGKKIVCVVSGGNFDFERLRDVKERAMRFAGLKKYLILRLPQRPGALKEFLNLLGKDDDIARFEYLKKSAKSFGSVLLGIETSAPENFQKLFAKMQERGLDFQDVSENELLFDLLV